MIAAQTLVHHCWPQLFLQIHQKTKWAIYWPIWVMGSANDTNSTIYRNFHQNCNLEFLPGKLARVWYWRKLYTAMNDTLQTAYSSTFYDDFLSFLSTEFKLHADWWVDVHTQYQSARFGGDEIDEGGLNLWCFIFFVLPSMSSQLAAREEADRSWLFLKQGRKNRYHWR